MPEAATLGQVLAEIRELRAEHRTSREDTARLAAEAIAARRELEQHRADDRRELDALHEQTQRLSTRQWLMVVSVTLLSAGSGAGAGAATATQILG